MAPWSMSAQAEILTSQCPSIFTATLTFQIFCASLMLTRWSMSVVHVGGPCRAVSMSGRNSESQCRSIVNILGHWRIRIGPCRAASVSHRNSERVKFPRIFENHRRATVDVWWKKREKNWKKRKKHWKPPQSYCGCLRGEMRKKHWKKRKTHWKHSTDISDAWVFAPVGWWYV